MTKGQSEKIFATIKKFIDTDIDDKDWYRNRLAVAEIILWAPNRTYSYGGYRYSMPASVSPMISEHEMCHLLEITDDPRFDH